jgi:hypothetical protein
MINSNLRVFDRSSCALAISLLFAMQSAQAGEATVVNVKGKANYSTTSGDGVVLKIGQRLGTAATITTSADAEVDLELGTNGGVLRVRSSSTLSLWKLDVPSDDTVDMELFLAKGSVVGKVKKLLEKSNYVIKTANSVERIRGTEFLITANGTVTVVSGTVVVAFAYPNSPPAIAKVQGGQIIEPVPAGSAAVPRVATAAELADARIPVPLAPLTK